MSAYTLPRTEIVDVSALTVAEYNTYINSMLLSGVRITTPDPHDTKFLRLDYPVYSSVRSQFE